MQPPKVILILGIITAIIGLFFIYLFFSVRIFTQPKPEVKVSPPAMTAEQIEKARRVKSLLDKIQTAPQSTTTPEEKAERVEALLEKIQTAPQSTTTPEEKAERIKSLLDKIK